MTKFSIQRYDSVSGHSIELQSESYLALICSLFATLGYVMKVNVTIVTSFFADVNRQMNYVDRVSMCHRTVYEGGVAAGEFVTSPKTPDRAISWKMSLW